MLKGKTGDGRKRIGLGFCAVAMVWLSAGASQHQTLSDVFSGLDVWDDGLSEMSYYDATDVLYGKTRAYTRVVLVNRQWMDPAAGVKADRNAAGAVPVFKLNISEEIPTENYNYRYLNTLFLKRPDLTPFKMVMSSQEWCGTTFKHVRWDEDESSFQTFSYFPAEGDQRVTKTPDVVPYESLTLFARSAVADRTTRFLNLLAPMRSTHLVVPQSWPARVTVKKEEQVTVPLGTFQATRVDVRWDGPPTSFWVESQAPYRLLKYEQGETSGALKFVERRPYWDRRSKSGFHKPNQAP